LLTRVIESIMEMPLPFRVDASFTPFTFQYYYYTRGRGRHQVRSRGSHLSAIFFFSFFLPYISLPCIFQKENVAACLCRTLRLNKFSAYSPPACHALVLFKYIRYAMEHVRRIITSTSRCCAPACWAFPGCWIQLEYKNLKEFVDRGEIYNIIVTRKEDEKTAKRCKNTSKLFKSFARYTTFKVFFTGNSDFGCIPVRDPDMNISIFAYFRAIYVQLIFSTAGFYSKRFCTAD
jgi:hypothetical protein